MLRAADGNEGDEGNEGNEGFAEGGEGFAVTEYPYEYEYAFAPVLGPSNDFFLFPSRVGRVEAAAAKQAFLHHHLPQQAHPHSVPVMVLFQALVRHQGQGKLLHHLRMQ
jgi:hypothetical protein